jgi:hydroxymethylbilane synthase
LTFAAYLQRDDIRDALVSRSGQALAELPFAATIGTSSVRRQAQISAHFPDLNPIPIRGNADTRLKKLDDGEYDALMLAVSGLQRINQEHRITETLPIDRFCPAVGAGVLGLTCRQDAKAIVSIAQLLNDEETARQVIAERTMLRQLGGNCHSPIAAYAAAEPNGLLSLTAMVFSRDGATILEAFEVGDQLDPIALGTNAAQALIRQGARELIDGTPSRKLTHTTPGGLTPR